MISYLIKLIKLHLSSWIYYVSSMLKTDSIHSSGISHIRPDHIRTATTKPSINHWWKHWGVWWLVSMGTPLNAHLSVKFWFGCPVNHYAVLRKQVTESVAIWVTCQNHTSVSQNFIISFNNTELTNMLRRQKLQNDLSKYELEYNKASWWNNVFQLVLIIIIIT